MKFKDDPEIIGIKDPRYILNLDAIVENEHDVFEDNLLKFKEVRLFYLHSSDSYHMLSSQIMGYSKLSFEDFMVFQTQAVECRFKISEI